MICVFLIMCTLFTSEVLTEEVTQSDEADAEAHPKEISPKPKSGSIMCKPEMIVFMVVPVMGAVGLWFFQVWSTDRKYVFKTWNVNYCEIIYICKQVASFTLFADIKFIILCFFYSLKNVYWLR